MTIEAEDNWAFTKAAWARLRRSWYLSRADRDVFSAIRNLEKLGAESLEARAMLLMVMTRDFPKFDGGKK